MASNPSTPWRADALLVEDRSEDVRGDLGTKLAHLLPGLSEVARSKLRERVIELIEILARDEAERVRAALSEAIKNLDCAPPSIVRLLATDSFLVVAEPVLRFSPLLHENDLLQIITGRHANGALAAIAGRQRLSPRVADAIAQSDETAAVATLLSNPSAQIREDTLDAIVDRAPAYPEWHGPLVDRPSLPQRLLRRLATFVRQIFLSRLASREDLDERTRAAIAQAMSDRASEQEREEAAHIGDENELTEERIKRLRRQGKLDEEAVAAGLDKGDRPFVRAAIAALAGIEPELVDKIISSRSAKGVVALAWRAKLGPRLAHQLQLRMAGLSPRQALGPRNGDWPMTADEMTWHLEFFGAFDSQLKPMPNRIVQSGCPRPRGGRARGGAGGAGGRRGDQGPHPPVVEEREQDRVRQAAVEDDRALDAALDRVEAGLHLRDHAPGERAVGDQLLDALRGEVLQQRLVAAEDADHVGHHQKPRGAHGAGDGAGGGVGIDVVGLAAVAEADRRDHRDDVGAGEGREQRRVDLFGLADETQIDRGFGAGRRAAARAHVASLAEQPAVATGQADRRAPGAVDRRGELLVDRAGQHHLDHLDGLLVGDAQAVDEAGLDREAVEHLRDLRAAAMDDDRIDADLLQQDDVAREFARRPLVAHRMAAVFHDHGPARVAAHEGQRLGENAALGDRLRGDAGGCPGWIGHALSLVEPIAV